VSDCDPLTAGLAAQPREGVELFVEEAAEANHAQHECIDCLGGLLAEHGPTAKLHTGELRSDHLGDQKRLLRIPWFELEQQ
jgi:hypothetical protein